eukprot:TRINITY_DN15119_c0_g1_i1.p1 TRINITY_DN15119_c0_g1~~TRINITY_DN15119_c0_g1_i1.p1  ORF type:complete len:231 (+),score=52.04 TRINITY_DN15119_c0_g1_i1:70-762(+)
MVSGRAPSDGGPPPLFAMNPVKQQLGLLPPDEAPPHAQYGHPWGPPPPTPAWLKSDPHGAMAPSMLSFEVSAATFGSPWGTPALGYREAPAVPSAAPPSTVPKASEPKLPRNGPHAGHQSSSLAGALEARMSSIKAMASVPLSPRSAGTLEAELRVLQSKYDTDVSALRAEIAHLQHILAGHAPGAASTAPVAPPASLACTPPPDSGSAVSTVSSRGTHGLQLPPGTLML